MSRDYWVFTNSTASSCYAMFLYGRTSDQPSAMWQCDNRWGEPDKFRLRFRTELTEVVGNIVRGGLAPTVEAVTRVAREHVPVEHLDDFVRMTINDLENLHEGNFARFMLRPSEFHAWGELQQRLYEPSG